MRRFIDILTSQFVAFISNLKDLLEVFVSLPDTLFGGGPTDQSLIGKVLLVLFRIVWLPVYAIGWLFLAPLRLFTDFSDERRRDFMYGLPALIFACFIAFVVILASAQSDAIDARYRQKGQEALAATDFAAAKTYFGRILSNGKENPDKGDVFNWAMSLMQTGETKRGFAILEGLAPFNESGFAKAHRIQALSLAQEVFASKDRAKLEELRWHLKESRDETVAINHAWAVYYMAIEQPAKALPYLEKDADKNPETLLEIARLHRVLGNDSAAERTLKRAEVTYRKILEDDPLDATMRVSLANVIVANGDIDEAEQVMIQGLNIADSKYMKSALASFYVVRHDRALENNEGFEKQFEYIRRAVTVDVNHIPAYQRLISLYQKAADPDELKTIKEAMLETISSDRPTSLAHFAYSNVLWLEGSKKDAEWHLEQAYQLDNNLVVVLNNLAWVLAHNEKDPDYERALVLSKKVVEAVPNDARFRDTYATVLMKMERYDEALIEFQKTILTIDDKKTIHGKLAFIFDKLGKPDLARHHRENAEQSK